jgi:acyl carrier protein
MTTEDAQKAVLQAVETVKGLSEGVEFHYSLTKDLGLESIDVVDLFFEIEQATGKSVELSQLVNRDGSTGRRFEDVTLQDVVTHLTQGD